MNVRDLARVAREYRIAEEAFWRSSGEWGPVHKKMAKLDRCISHVLADDGLPVAGTVGDGGKVTWREEQS